MKMHGMCVEKTQIFFIYIYAWPLQKIIYRLTDRNSKTKCFLWLPADGRRYLKCENFSDSPHMIYTQ